MLSLSYSAIILLYIILPCHKIAVQLGEIFIHAINNLGWMHDELCWFFRVHDHITKIEVLTFLEIDLFAECSNNAPVPNDGDRVIRASEAFTCSWVITVPENYTVRLTITQKNVGSIGNTNCANDYIQVSA